MLVNLYPDGDIEEVAITDFGSCSPLLVTVKNRKDALNVTDFHSHATTAPFRAHELWDVPSEFVVTGKADAFSVGCCHYFNMVGKQPFDFNVGKIVLPKGWGTYFGDFAVECALGLTLRNPGERMGLGECKRAIERGGIDGVMRKLIEIEYGVELKRERGEYTFKKNKRGRGGGGVVGNFADFEAFHETPGGMGEGGTKGEGGGDKGMEGEDEFGSFQGSPVQVSADVSTPTKDAKEENKGRKTSTFVPTSPPISPTSGRRKGAVKMLRPRGWGINGRKLVMKTIWVSLDETELVLHKTSLNSSKNHLTLNLPSTDMVDVSISHTLKEGDSALDVGGEVGDTCFVVSYSDVNEECGGGRVELYAKDMRDAENWQRGVAANWERARGQGM